MWNLSTRLFFYSSPPSASIQPIDYPPSNRRARPDNPEYFMVDVTGKIDDFMRSIKQHQNCPIDAEKSAQYIVNFRTHCEKFLYSINEFLLVRPTYHICEKTRILNKYSQHKNKEKQKIKAALKQLIQELQQTGACLTTSEDSPWHDYEYNRTIAILTGNIIAFIKSNKMELSLIIRI
jgi:hypothetical protein